MRLGPHRDLTGMARGLGVSAAAALFMTISGAFGSNAMPWPLRLTYWMAMMGGGYFWGAFVTRSFLGESRRRTGNLWLDALLCALIMSIPYTVVVWVVSGTMFGARLGVSALPMLSGSVLAVCMALTTINMLIEARRHAITTASPTPPKFLERLPLKLRGAEVWAVEAEDHYLRLHTSKGQDLILLRLADAVAELEGIEGLQVHRSWWVARDAITDAKRGDGRALLTLKDGAEVPVSRTYAGLLRDRGWI
ncbi:LytTR family DNA-binding domain-containing protein [Phenylobacterium sp.]|uniref:LytTR family DNA-binding domain-containing protein n=1 Tax=Phenylobacterium sp. TaxID=1871053 RepID=UPI0025F966F3|nr:LytTR family DNA-binding domain-containing protein [Phenylobacterium sp.]